MKAPCSKSSLDSTLSPGGIAGAGRPCPQAWDYRGLAPIGVSPPCLQVVMCSQGQAPWAGHLLVRSLAFCPILALPMFSSLNSWACSLHHRIVE